MSGRYGRMFIGVPSLTASYISSISSLVTAMQPAVQSFHLCQNWRFAFSTRMLSMGEESMALNLFT